MGHILVETMTRSNDPVQCEFGKARVAVVMLMHCLLEPVRVCEVRQGDQLRAGAFLGVIDEHALVRQAVKNISNMVTCETLERLQGWLMCPQPSPCGERT